MRFLLSLVLEGSIWKWVLRLGGPGLILLGLADNSAIPLPGSMDAFVIILSSHHRHWWPYYGFMATLGGLLGGYVTYRIASKGEEEVLEKKIGKQRTEKVYRRFKKHGFSSVMIGALLPPPFPIVPFLIAAGALQYPRKKFIGALALGRGIRYFAEGYLADLYGKEIISALQPYYQPLLYTLIGVAVLGAIGALLYFKWYRPKRQREEKQRGEPVETFPIPGKGNRALKRSENQGQSNRPANRAS